MNTNRLGSEAEKYKREMMKLYSRRTPAEEYSRSTAAENISVPVTDFREVTDTVPSVESAPKEEIIEETNNLLTPVSPSIQEVDADAPDDSAWSPFSEADFAATPYNEEEFNTRYPDPDISDIEDAADENVTAPIYESLESLGTSTGYIKVNVRTGDDSSGVEGASVSVIAVVDGNRLIIAQGITDSSGSVPKFSVPVPDSMLSQSPDSRTRPYSLYDVTVTAEGFFNARSVDVPVFAKTTSVQNFSMIPLPLFMNENDETVTYYNQEPDLLSGRE